MGALRFILAMSVVIAHLSPFGSYRLLDGQTAVQSFFAVSGFYMGLILNTKYPNSRTGFFVYFSNRLLRLFPIYYICLFLSIAISIYAAFALNRHPIATLINFPLQAHGLISVLLSQLSIVGMDIALLFHRDASGALVLSQGDMLQQPQPYLFDYFLVPQAWSLGLELCFYAIAPFIVRNPRYCIIVIVVSLSARFITYGFEINYPPFDYRFFPFEIAIFALGALSFHAYQRFDLAIANNRNFIFGVYLMIFGFPLIFTALPYTQFAGIYVKQWLYVVLVIVSLPILFKMTRSDRRDRLFGELSYPIYISHLLIASMISFAFGLTGTFLGIASLIPILAFSYVLLWPQAAVERLRQRRTDTLEKEVPSTSTGVLTPVPAAPAR